MGIRSFPQTQRLGPPLHYESTEMRPTLHFTAQRGWINDPHGITARNGGYDVFFQYVPHSTTWAPSCHWGHARGADLLSLNEREIAIAPGDGDDGIWTGCVVVDADNATAFYTATSTPDFGIGRVRVARPTDPAWDNWEKGDTVVVAPKDLDLIAYRDPFIKREADGWRMFVGAAGTDGTAMALTYTSSDLDTWHYDGIALSRSITETEPVWMGGLWECPQIFEIDGVAVMISSIWDQDVLHYAGYAIGSFDAGRFAPTRWGQLTWGDSMYAPSLFADADGRACLSFWLRGIEGEDWAGAHSIPYLLSIVDGDLVAKPHSDVNAHRLDQVFDGQLPALTADLHWYESRGSIEITSGGEAAAILRRDAANITITVGDTESSVPVSGTVRIIIDGPVLEVASDAGLYATAVQPKGAKLCIAAANGLVDIFPLA